MNRVLAAARLHHVNPLVMLGIPWLVVGISFAVNVAAFGLTAAGDDGSGFTGGVASLYITVFIVFVQAVTQLLPLAMGLSLSRRTFYLGTALVAVVQSLAYGVVLAVLAAVESGTEGWGVGLAFWAPEPMDVHGFLPQVLVSGGPMLASTSAGIGVGVVMKRWGQVGLWGLVVGVVVVLGGLAVLISWLDGWHGVGSWLGDRSVLTLAAALPAALAVVLAGLGWAGIRRTVP